MKRLHFLIYFLALFLLVACDKTSSQIPNLPPEQQKELSQQAAELEADIASTPDLDSAKVIDLALVYEQMGQVDKAIERYEDYIKEHGEEFVLLNNLARLYEQQGNYEKATSLFKKLIEDYSEDEYLYDLTNDYIQLKDLENAQKSYEDFKIKLKRDDSGLEDGLKKLSQGN